MKRVKPGFTLIEMMMVVLVISLLIVMLVPVIGAVKKAVRISMTEGRIWEIDSAICLYKDTFGDYPPGGRPPLPAGDLSWSGYPDGWFPLDPGKQYLRGYQLFNPNYTDPDGNGPMPSQGPGALFLTYFLFGPQHFGWDPGEHGVSVNWTAPDGLNKYMSKKPVTNDGHYGDGVYRCATSPYYVFEDAFGLTGAGFRGAILYLRADVRNRSPMVGNGHNARWAYSQVGSQYYWECRGGNDGYTGDNEPQQNLARLLEQCPKSFALLSAGADHFFGYRTQNTHSYNQKRPGADWDDGVTDDITNFVHD